jgi:hypothetical protein
MPYQNKKTPVTAGACGVDEIVAAADPDRTVADAFQAAPEAGVGLVGAKCWTQYIA